MKKEKMNNKGFSLVELIIVIAIMAVLVVVLAPQYLKYVEKSRNSTDTSNATSIVTALQVYAADPEADKPFSGGDKVIIIVSSSGGAINTDNTDKSGKDALDEAAINISDVKCKSKNEWNEYQIYGEVQSDGSIDFTYYPSTFATKIGGKTESSPVTPTP